MRNLKQIAETFVTNDPELSAMLRAVDTLGDAFAVVNKTVTEQERELFRRCVHLVAERVAQYAQMRMNNEIISRSN